MAHYIDNTMLTGHNEQEAVTALALSVGYLHVTEK